HVRAHLALSEVAWEDDRVRDSARHALEASALANDVEVLVAATAALMRVGEVVAARRCMEHPLLATTTSVPLMLQLAEHRYALNENSLALALCDRAKAAGAAGPGFSFLRGVQLTFNGRLKEAESELLACVRQEPTYGRAWQELSRLRKQTAQDNHLSDLAKALQIVAPGSYEHASIEFARYKELEDLGRLDEAWAALAHGNAIMYARHKHDPAHTRRL